MTLAIFYILSIISVLSALMVVFSRNPVYSVLYLIVTFFSIAGHYILLNAQFLAAVHVIVYAGAIMVLFLYVIMLLNLNKEAELPAGNHIGKFIAVITGGVFMVLLTGALKGVESIQEKGIIASDAGLIKNLGHVLYKQYLLPFEISSVLFLAAMVGAVLIGKNEHK